MPDAYKDVDSVVEAVQEAGLAKMVAAYALTLSSKVSTLDRGKCPKAHTPNIIKNVFLFFNTLMF